AISAAVKPLDNTARSFFELSLVAEGVRHFPQSIELTLGVSLRVLRLLIGADYTPVSVHIPHAVLTTEDDYRTYFGCPPRFSQSAAGFTLRTVDLTRPLNDDQLAHESVVRYLTLITQRDASIGQSVRAIVRQLLPTGTVTLQLIAAQLNLHPKTLQRRLSN